MLSQKLKEARQRQGFSQQQVARLLGVERSTYSYYETGKTTPSIKNLVNLAQIFRVSVDELLAGMQDTTEELLVKCDQEQTLPMRLSPREFKLIVAFRTMNPTHKSEAYNSIMRLP